ncbi:MAG: helix-turn-helix transcriptional regulator [Clostridiales bacterium]|jgi:DNA-binding Xre family transcriptional regulator|nr:helix-turn-helix transcriptional regulator [Clostridiales bacterium]
MEYLRKIDTERARQGLSISELAYKAGVADITLKKLFSGKSKNTTVDTVFVLCDALELSAASIFTTEGEFVMTVGAEDMKLLEAIRKVSPLGKKTLLDLMLLLIQ